MEQEEKPAITLAHTELDALRLWGHQKWGLHGLGWFLRVPSGQRDDSIAR